MKERERHRQKQKQGNERYTDFADVHKIIILPFFIPIHSSIWPYTYFTVELPSHVTDSFRHRHGTVDTVSPLWPSLLHPAVRLAQEALYISVRYTGRPHTDWPISLAGAATSIIFVATKVCVCRDKHNFVATKLVGTSLLLSRQAYFCRDKRRVLSRQTDVLVVAKKYLWQLPPMVGQGPAGPSDPCITQARQYVALLQ